MNIHTNKYKGNFFHRVLCTSEMTQSNNMTTENFFYFCA